MLNDVFGRDRAKREALVSGHVVADRTRCVECGICSYNCPLGIDVRGHVRLEQPVTDGRCLTCGECVARCPRGTLRFETSAVFTRDEREPECAGVAAPILVAGIR